MACVRLRPGERNIRQYSPEGERQTGNAEQPAELQARMRFASHFHSFVLPISPVRFSFAEQFQGKQPDVLHTRVSIRLFCAAD